MEARWTPVWVGVYPTAGASSPPGAGEGIWYLEADLTTGSLRGATQVAVTPAPSFVAAHPSGRILYAVGETTPGTVSAFDVVDTEQPPRVLRLRESVGSGGDLPCHILLSHDARTLYISNYLSGTLAVVELSRDGSFEHTAVERNGPLQIFSHSGSGPVRDRQESPHAHSSLFTPDGRHLVVLDLGTDELRRYSIGPGGLLAHDGIAAVLPRGTGPRHAVFSLEGNHLYVVGELDDAVHVLRWDRETATGTEIQRVSTAGSDAHAGFPSHVALDRQSLVVGVRVRGELVRFTLRADGLIGPARPLTLPGTWPRHFYVSDGWCIVGLERAGRVVAVDLTTRGGFGRPAQYSRIPLPAPACIVAAAGHSADPS